MDVPHCAAEDENLPVARRLFYHPRLDTRLESIIEPPERTVLWGVCWACRDTAPRGWEPKEVQLYAHRSTPNLSCSWCCMTRRVHLLGQRLARDHPSYDFIMKLLGAILEHLILHLRPAHDEDDELAEFEIRPVFENELP